MLVVKKKHIEHIVNWNSVSDVCFASGKLYITVMGDSENQIIIEKPKTADGRVVDSKIMVTAMIENYCAWEVIEGDN